MDDFRVSVVMAVYNGERFLSEQLESVLRQTYPLYEIIISDDASTDGTLAVAMAYQKKYPSIRVIKSDHNVGLNGNFEKAIRSAGGDVIAICDQDNIWKDHRIERMIDHISDHLLVYSDSELIKENRNTGKRLSSIKKYHFTDGETPKEFYFYNSVFGHNTIFRKELTDFMLPFPKSGLNYDGWISFVASCTGRMKYVDEVLAYFRIHDSNITSHMPSGSNPGNKRETRLNRRREYNERLLQRLLLFQSFNGLAKDERSFLDAFIEEVRRLDDSYFRFQLFWMIIRHRKSLLHLKKGGKAFSKAFAQATGIRWHRLVGWRSR